MTATHSSEHTIEVPIEAPEGLHARPAAELAQRAAAYEATVTIHVADRQADAKSVLTLLSLGADSGAWIRLTAVGPDAAEAIRDLAAVIAPNHQEAAP